MKRKDMAHYQHGDAAQVPAFAPVECLHRSVDMGYFE
jgi:hypothetical protein